MIPIPEVALILRGWAEDKRRLRVIARFGVADFSAYCVVREANEQSFSLFVGDDPLNMFGLYFDGWVFDFGDAPPDAEGLPIGGKVESAIVGGRRGSHLWLMLLTDD
jgi:hypothetical protein